MRLNLRIRGAVSRLRGHPWAEPEASQWQPGQTQFPLEDPGVGYLAADAYFAGPAYGSLTANAVLAYTPPAPPTTEAAYTANAAIRAVVPLFEDDFNRVEASGYGSASSSGHAYTPTTSGGTGTTSVDGSQLVLDNTGSYYFDGVTVAGFVIPVAATAQFDFYVGATPTEYVYYELDASDGNVRLHIYVAEDGGGDWALNAQWIYQPFTPTPSTWYTAKVAYVDGPGGGMASKVWKRSDPEPDWQVFDTHANVLDPGPSGLTYIWVENDGTDLAQLDNIRLYQSGGTRQVASLAANAAASRTIGDGSTTTPEFIGSSRGEHRGGGIVSLAKPSGLAVDDLMVIVMRSSTVVIPDGWDIGPSQYSFESTRLYVLSRFATASDVAGSAFNLATGASFGYGHLVAWRGASQYETFANTTYGTASPATATDRWVGVAGTAVQISWVQGASSLLPATVTSSPDGMTEAESARAMATYWELFPVPGQLGTKALTFSVASTIYMLQLHIVGAGRFLAANAYFVPATGQETVTGSLTADAWFVRTQEFAIAATAVIVRGGRTVHSAHLHFGGMDDLAVLLSAALGSVPQGSTLHDALVELESRISARESTGT